MMQVYEFHIIDDTKTYDSQQFNNMIYPLQIADIDFIHYSSSSLSMTSNEITIRSYLDLSSFCHTDGPPYRGDDTIVNKTQ